ncbi:MAG: Acetylornithine deacetylase/Succinyl-diaminopimelate desuccinylase [Chloroflexi bacterium]|nr:MAG: Acetylornithine deacetylase/Succinyl-diaminopimelate desuccinylase [Chloroflexota bacterium]
MQPSRSRDVADIIEGDRDELVALALDLAGIHSPAGHERPAAEFVANWLNQAGIQSRVQPLTADSANAIGLIRGNDSGRSLIFDAHLDNEPPAGGAPATEMEQRLERGFVEDGLLVGPTIINCKGQVAAFLIAARAIHKSGIQLGGDLTVAAVASETGQPSVGNHQGIDYPGEGFGTRWMIDRGVIADYALIGETSGFGIVAAECGVAQIQVSVPGRVVYTPRLTRPADWQSHPNPFVKASHIVQALEVWAEGYEHQATVEFYGGTIVPKAQVVGIDGGPNGSHFGSPECVIYLDVRLAPGADPKAVRREVSDAVKALGVSAEVSLYQWSRGFIAQNVEPLIEAIETAHHSLHGEAPPPPPAAEMSMWRDINPFNEVGIPAVCYGPPRLQDPYSKVGNRAMKIDDLVAATKVYAMTALQICGVSNQTDRPPSLGEGGS